ncbi:ImcF-related family protein, partial [Paraburkholderia sediminicola]|uniref:ImcF-related family protein n=1 Tax=Paraburkholderia sediminicola TaxID=458836 RepID=UPI0038B97A29
MKNRKVLGYWIVVGSMTVGLAATAMFKGESINPSATVRVLAVLLAGAVFLLLQSALAWAWRRFAQLAPTRKSDRYSRDPAARVVSAENRDWELELAQELRTRYGWRWRYCLPWVLVSGDDRLVANQLPGLARKQWSANDDVVLLWAPRSRNGLLDEAWLLKLRKLRRRRPIDAVALVLDGRNDPSALVRRSTSFASLCFGITRALRFSAPVYLVADSGIKALGKEALEPVGCLLPRKHDDAVTAGALRALGDSLAIKGTRRIAEDRRYRYFAALSVQIGHRCETLTEFVAALSTSARHSLKVRGLWFLPSAGGQVTTDPDAVGLPALWSEIGRSGTKSGGRRTGWHPSTVCATIVTIFACVWIAGMFISGASNTRELLYANQLARQQASTPDSRSGLHALRDLQQDIERFEYRASTGAPWYSRFGLNHDKSILAGLWQTYTPASRRLLVLPVQQGLESSLTTVAAMRTDISDGATNEQALEGHKMLRAYLMLAEPKRADAKVMEPELTRNWLTNAGLTTGERQDLGHQFFQFFAQHLPAHPDWAIQPRADLVNGTRQTLLAITGVKNSTDTLYHSILDAAAGKYGDQSLATMLAGTDATGLFHTSATVPGV